MARKPRAAVYIRRSKAVAGDPSSTAEVQEETCTAYIEREGGHLDPVTGIYRDLGRSAWRTGAKRDDFDKLLAACMAGKYDWIVVYRMDRLSRDWATWGRILDSLPDDFEIRSATENLNSVANKFAVQIMAAVAEEASDAIQKRVSGAKAVRIKQGAWVGSIRPFGWVPVDDGGRRTLVLKEDEAQALRHVVDMVLQGQSVSAGARWLSENGWATTMPPKVNDDGSIEPKNIWWSRTSLLRLLRSPVMIGCRGSKIKKGERQEEVIYVDGKPLQVFEPLIDQETWNRLKERLQRQSKSRHRPSSSLLAGLVRCAACGYALGSGGPPEGHTSVYRCRSRLDRGPQVCEGCSISRPRLDQHVSVLALLLLVGPAPSTITGDETKRIAEVTASIEQVVNDLHPLGREQPMPETRRALQSRLEDMEAELRRLKKAVEGRRGPVAIPTDLDAEFRDALTDAGADASRLSELHQLTSWMALDTNARREMITSVIDRVEVARGNRSEVARLPNEQRGRVGHRLQIALARDPSTLMTYDEALAVAMAGAALRLAG